jgi:hypothetical protein
MLIANTDGTRASFTAVAKHIQGDRGFGTDSDTTSVFQDPTPATFGIAVVLLAASAPASVVAADDFTGVAAWVAK